MFESRDSTTSTILTDSSWRTLASSPPNGFEGVNFDDSAWSTAFVVGSFSSPAMWAGQVQFGVDSPSTDVISGANWIWTDEMNNANQNAPGPSSRPFRKKVATPSGKKAISADISLTVDNSFSLYVNGRLVGSTTGSSNTWQSGQVFQSVSLNPDSNVFAVAANNFAADGTTNDNSAAGLVAAIILTLEDATSIVSNPTTTSSPINEPPSSSVSA
jgi:hypothetical protein